jgi:hypothetical protein
MAGHLSDDLLDRHAANALMHDRALQRGLASVKQRLEVAAGGLHAMDDLRHGEALRQSGIIVVRDGGAGAERLVLTQSQRASLGEDALDAQQVSEMCRDVPHLAVGGEAKLLLSESAHRREEPFATGV